MRMQLQHPAQFVVKSIVFQSQSRSFSERRWDSRTGRLRYIYNTLSIFLARVEPVHAPGAPSLEAFSTQVIPAEERRSKALTCTALIGVHYYARL